MTITKELVPIPLPSMSRRTFIVGLVGGLAATAVGLSGLETLGRRGGTAAMRASTGSTAPPRSLATMMLSTFSEHVGQRFRIHLGLLGWMYVRLVEVTDLSAKYSPASVGGTLETTEDVFSVVFSGPRSHPLEQDTYSIEHAELGEFELFIVPIGPAEGSPRYEAVFNRALPVW